MVQQCPDPKPNDAQTSDQTGTQIAERYNSPGHEAPNGVPPACC